jgi:hypothetical protein
MEPAHIDPEVKSDHSIVVHIRDTLGIVDGLKLPLLPTSTIGQVKELILKHTDQLPYYLILSSEGNLCLEGDKQLRDCVRNGSTISVITEFEIYLNFNIPGTTRVSVTIATSASISVVRLLAFEKTSKDTGFNPFTQVMTCASLGYSGYSDQWSDLHESQAIGVNNNVIPGCEIYFNKTNSK